MTISKIPFNKPFVSNSAKNMVLDSLNSSHLSGDGPMTHDLRNELLKLIPSYGTLLTPSCTHALEMTISALNLKPGDEVIVPSFTFSSTANSIILGGGTPVFVDVDSETLNIDPSEIAKAITNKTKAVLVVHYAGISSNLDEIIELVREFNLTLIEDNAHGLFGKYKGFPLGSFGEMSTVSFHETKNIQCGEGGAIFFKTDKFFEIAEIFREKGTNRSKFFRGQIDKYNWIDKGSSMLLADTLAGMTLGQIKSKDYIQSKRMYIWNTYLSELSNWATLNGYKVPSVPEYASHPAHIFYLRAPNLETRSQLIQFANDSGVGLAFHYQALHSSPAGKKYGRSVGNLPISSKASDDLVRLPIWVEMSDSDIEQVVETVKASSSK